MSQLVKNITAELLTHVDPHYRDGAMRFFKEPIHPIGVRTPIVRRIARTWYPKHLQKPAILSLAEELLEKRTFEHTLIAFAWAYTLQPTYTKKDVQRFTRWISQYVDNWAFCDDFCTHAYGAAIATYPEFLSKLLTWTKSKNRWERRAAAVTLIHIINRKDKTILPAVFKTVDALLLDEDDLVQKGYGWMLKVASNFWPADVFQFVLERKDRMPRTALRYAIEKYPKEMKKEAMKKTI